MVEDGLNISSGINQGAAQILHPFHNPITPQLELAVVQQEQAKKAATDKKKADLYGTFKDFSFKGLPNHAGYFVNKYNQIIDEAAVDLKNGDPLTQIKSQQKMGDLNTQMQLNADLKKEASDAYDYITKNAGKQIFPNANEALAYALADLKPEETVDMNAYGKAIADKVSKLQGIIGINRFDELKAKKDALTLFNMQAGIKADKGAEFYGLGDAKNDVRDFILGSPENLGAQYYYENLLKNDPLLQKQYGDDWQKLATDRLAEEVNKIPKPNKGITIINGRFQQNNPDFNPDENTTQLTGNDVVGGYKTGTNGDIAPVLSENTGEGWSFVPIKAQTTGTGQAINLSTGKSIDAGDANYSRLKIVPVTTTSQGGYSANVPIDNKFAAANKIPFTYKLMAYGTQKQGSGGGATEISVVRPYSDIHGVFQREAKSGQNPTLDLVDFNDHIAGLVNTWGQKYNGDVPPSLQEYLTGKNTASPKGGIIKGGVDYSKYKK